MAKKTKPLSDLEIKRIKYIDKEFKLYDGNNLYVVIHKNGSKYFRLDYKFNDKRRTLGIGVYPSISIKEARAEADKIRELLKQGIDPKFRNKKEEVLTIVTFSKIYYDWLEIAKTKWTADSTLKKCQNAFNNNVLPFIGDKDMKNITRLDILAIIDSMQNRNIYTLTNKVLGYINGVFKYAVTYGYISHNIITDIDKKAVIKEHQVKHFSALTKPKDIKLLLQSIKDYKGDISTCYALLLAPYIFLRPGNLRSLEWSEIDFDNDIIEIPAHKMKTGKNFVIPMTSQIKSILLDAKRYSYAKSKYVFPAPTSNLRQLSENTLNQALMRMGYKEQMTSHGFRSVFSTIAHENISKHGFHSDIIEICLAHAEKDKIKAAYNRSSKMKYYDDRKKLMRWFNNYLDNL